MTQVRARRLALLAVAAVLSRPLDAAALQTPSRPADVGAIQAVGQIRLVEGPLEIKVVYPAPDDRVDVQDSSFVFGSVGDGRASLTINGQRARVYPNGAFLGWIRYPSESPARLRLVARRGSDSASATVAVARVERFRPSGAVWIDTTSMWPRGRVWWPRDDVLPFSLRATTGARVELVLPSGKRVAFAATESPPPVPAAVRAFDRDTMNLRRPVPGDRYEAVTRGLRIGALLGPVLGESKPAPPPRKSRRRPPPAPKALRVEAIRGRDTVRAAWPLQVDLLDSLPIAAMVDDDPTGTGTTDGITVGRAHPGATYHWFFPNGTVAGVSGRINDEVRLRLGTDASAWVAAADLVPRSPALVANRAVVGSVTMTPEPDRLTVRIPVGRRVPFQVDEDPSTIRLTLYRATADINWLRYGRTDSLLAVARWRQATTDQVELVFDLNRPAWGYRTRWERDDLILEIRRPPPIDPFRPLAGRLIVIDPGHPPIGSTGPTGLTEPEANLAIALALEQMLEGAGARVLLTRRDGRPVELWPRVHFADSVDADALVSIHNNALPDGLNPATNTGSSTFYFHPQSYGLARRTEIRLVEQLGTRDLGVGRADLAMARPTWMPAILTEGLFIMLPEHEAMLRDEDGQRRYARAVYQGLEDFFRDRAAGRP